MTNPNIIDAGANVTVACNRVSELLRNEGTVVFLSDIRSDLQDIFRMLSEAEELIHKAL